MDWSSLLPCPHVHTGARKKRYGEGYENGEIVGVKKLLSFARAVRGNWTNQGRGFQNARHY